MPRIQDSYNSRMDLLNKMIADQEEQEKRNSQMDNQALQSELVTGVAQGFGRPQRTAAHIRAGVSPQQQANIPNYAPKYLQMKKQAETQALLDRYKNRFAQSDLLLGMEEAKEGEIDKTLGRRLKQAQILKALAAAKGQKSGGDTWKATPYKNDKGQIIETNNKGQYRPSPGTEKFVKASDTEWDRRHSMSEVEDGAKEYMAHGRGTQGFKSLYERNRQARNALGIVDALKEGMRKEKAGTATKEDIAANKAMAQELAATMARMLTGGVPAIQTIEHLIPQSLHGDVNEMVQYVTGSPQNFLNESFIAQFEHQLKREQDFFEKDLTSTQKAIKARMKPHFKKYPELQEMFDDMALAMEEQKTNLGPPPAPEKPPEPGFLQAGAAAGTPMPDIEAVDGMSEEEVDRALKLLGK